EDPDWQRLLTARLCVVADDLFDFLAETATEVAARIRIDEKSGTVARGALWYEEALPAEALLWGVVGVDRSRYADRAASAAELLAALADSLGRERRLQVGGKAAVGRGQVRLLLQRAGEDR
ncbi:MAG: type III-B CRISPR module RAMP protein Cmr4, partial [Nitrospirae bacterium]